MKHKYEEKEMAAIETEALEYIMAEQDRNNEDDANISAEIIEIAGLAEREKEYEQEEAERIDQDKKEENKEILPEEFEGQVSDIQERTEAWLFPEYEEHDVCESTPDYTSDEGDK